jgi:ketosteroid isomerase-like protein
MVHPIISLEIMMSAAENKKLMQEIFAGLAVGDRSLFRQSVTDSYRIVVMGRSSWSQTIEGDALRKYLEYVRARFSAPGKTIPERFIADGDIVAVEARGDNYSASGERYDNQYCLIFRFEDGKIAEMREYMDTAFCERLLGRYPTPAAEA